VQRGIESNHTVENVALEVNSLKFAQNRSFADCLQAILPTLLASLGLAAKPKKERPKEVNIAQRRRGCSLSCVRVNG